MKAQFQRQCESFGVYNAHENEKNSTHDISSFFKPGVEQQPSTKNQKTQDKINKKDDEKAKKSETSFPDNVISLDQFRGKKDE